MCVKIVYTENNTKMRRKRWEEEQRAFQQILHSRVEGREVGHSRPRVWVTERPYDVRPQSLEFVPKWKKENIIGYNYF